MAPSDRFKLASGLVGLVLAAKRKRTGVREDDDHNLAISLERLELGRRFLRFGNRAKSLANFSSTVNESCENLFEKYQALYGTYSMTSEVAERIRWAVYVSAALDTINNLLEDGGFIVHLFSGSEKLESRLNFASDCFWMLSTVPCLAMGLADLKWTVELHSKRRKHHTTRSIAAREHATKGTSSPSTPDPDYVPLVVPSMPDEESESVASCSSDGGSTAEELKDSALSVLECMLDMCEALYCVFGNGDDDDSPAAFGLAVPSALASMCASVSLFAASED